MPKKMTTQLREGIVERKPKVTLSGEVECNDSPNPLRSSLCLVISYRCICVFFCIAGTAYRSDLLCGKDVKDGGPCPPYENSFGPGLRTYVESGDCTNGLGESLRVRQAERPYVLETNRDITERLRIEEELRQANDVLETRHRERTEERLRQAVESAPNGMLM